jgi:hypothetical protein
MRLCIVFVALVSCCLAPTAALAQTNPSCQFQLGFKTLHDLDPADIGDCLDNEAHNSANGDALQHTTKGLMAWRKADNWTAFTNGYQTWINGPNGLVQRFNYQRFSWEADAYAYLLADPPPGYIPNRYQQTGTFLRDTARTGQGKLTIQNGADTDAVIVLTNLSSAPLLSVYVRSGDSYTVTGIRDGQFRVFFATGHDWDTGAAVFTRDASLKVFQDTLAFVTTSTQYTIWTLTLHVVSGGNAPTQPVDPSQFPHP